MEPRPSLGIAVTGDPGDASHGVGEGEPSFPEDEFPSKTASGAGTIWAAGSSSRCQDQRGKV